MQGSRFMSPCFVFLLNVRIVKSCNSEHQDSCLQEIFIAWVMVSDEASLGRTLRLVTSQRRYNYLSVYGEKRVVYDCLASGTAECGNASWSKSSKSPELEFMIHNPPKSGEMLTKGILSEACRCCGVFEFSGIYNETLP